MTSHHNPVHVRHEVLQKPVYHQSASEIRHHILLLLHIHAALDMAFEISSMGIRVDENALREQLVKAGCPEREELAFQKAILEKKLPYTIGGGIGQSRICMYFLRKAHIGEVQASIWPEDVLEEAEKKNLRIL